MAYFPFLNVEVMGLFGHIPCETNQQAFEQLWIGLRMGGQRLNLSKAGKNKGTSEHPWKAPHIAEATDWW